MAKCSVCGQKAGLMMSMCDICIDKENQRLSDKRNAPTMTKIKVISSDAKSGCSEIVFGVGLLLMGIGFYNLLNPALPEAPASVFGDIQGIVNLHKLFIGQTLTILGGIFTIAGAKGMKLI